MLYRKNKNRQKKINKKTDVYLKIETPYPKKKKVKKQKSDTTYWGEKMVKLQDRVNELELSLNNIHLRLDKVAGRLGM